MADNLVVLLGLRLTTLIIILMTLQVSLLKDGIVLSAQSVVHTHSIYLKQVILMVNPIFCSRLHCWVTWSGY